MYKPIARIAAVLGLSLFTISSAGAITLTFDSVPGGSGGCSVPGQSTVTEGGFLISNCPEAFLALGEIHLDDAGPYLSFVEFSAVDGSLFNAISVLIEGFGTWFLDPVLGTVSYDNILFQGYRDGNLVAEQGFSTSFIPLGTSDVVLAEFLNSFSKLDLLRISQVFPDSALMNQFPDAVCEDIPCGHVSLQEITLAKVPLPAGLPLILTGILALGLVARRRLS